MKFSQNEVDEFCKLVGDTNPIHKNNVGVVPGLQVMSIITKNPEPGIVLADATVRFINPLYVEEDFDLIKVKTKEKMNLVYNTYIIRTHDRIIQEIKCILARVDKIAGRPE